MGKGSTRRPAKISEAEQEANWDRIFNKSKEADNPVKEPVKDDEKERAESKD